MDPIAWVAVIGLFLSILGFFIGGQRYIDGRILRVDERHEGKLDAAKETINTRIDSVGVETRLMIEKVEEAERRSRHDLANNVMGQLGEIRRDIRRIEQDSVSKNDLSSLEHRMDGRFDKMDGKLDRVCERLNVVDKPHG